MADNRLVFNTTAYPIVVSSRGVRVLSSEFRTIDITETRAQNALASGALILANTEPEPEPAAPEPAPEPTPEEPIRAGNTSRRSKNQTTNGE